MIRALPVCILAPAAVAVAVAVVAVMVGVVAGCHVPISPSAPLDPPTAETIDDTAFAMHIEYPAVDMLATVASEPDPAAPHRYPTVSFPTFSAHLATGLGPSTGVQFGVEGTVYSVIPVPQGAWLGLRRLLSAGETRDIGVAIRGGYAGFASRYDELPYDGSTVSVAYAALTGSVRFKQWRAAQPGLAVTAQPLLARPSIAGLPPGEDIDPLYGVLAAGTLGIKIKRFTPFVTGGVLATTNTRGLSPYVSFGLALSQN